MRKSCISCLMILSLAVAPFIFGSEKGGGDKGPIWTFDTGGPVRSTPVVHGSNILIGSDCGILFSVAIDSGEEQWSFEADSAIASDPCLGGDSVYFATKKGSLYSIDPDTAAVNWLVTTEAESLYEGGWDYFVSSPVVVGDRVIFGSGDGRIRALSKRAGEEIWVFDSGSVIRSTPAFSETVIYGGTMEGELYALDIETGRTIWKFKTTGNKNFPKGEILFQPVVHRGVVCFGSRDAVFYALQAETGSLLWKVDASGPWYTKAAAVNDTVFAASSDGRFVQALDISTGSERWKVSAGDLVFSRPTVSEGILYFGSHDSWLYAVDTENGRLLQRYGTEDSVLSSALVDRGILYFGSDDGRLYAFRCPRIPPQSETQSFKAVYRDPRMDAKAERFLSYEEQKVLLFLKDRGYEILDAPKLVNFMKSRIKDKTSGAIVLLSVNLPYAVFEAPENQATLFQRYLKSHNSLISIQSSAYLVTSKETEDTLFIPEGLSQILGLSTEAVQHGFFYYDSYISRPTEAGKNLGLPLWWSSGFGIDPGEVDTVLGLDEHGRATAWVKNCGGPEGTGFVRIWGGRHFPEDLSFITRAAESAIEALREIPAEAPLKRR